MKVSPLVSVISAASASSLNFSASDFPNHLVACKGTVCTIKCKFIPKYKALKVEMNSRTPDQIIDCPSLAEAGCPTTWGSVYTQGRRVFQQSTNDIVPANGIKDSSKTGKLTITCVNSDSKNKAKCTHRLISSAGNPKTVQFSWKWDKNNEVVCPGPGDAWASWSSWSSASSTKGCTPSTVSRSRLCLGGNHPGSPVACSSAPSGSSTENKTFWPKSCGKCHADLTMMYIPGEINVPKLPLPKDLEDHDEEKFDDGFVMAGEGVVKMRCYDESSYTKPYKQVCRCDNNGCRLGSASLCRGADYKGYGDDYLWMPGAKDTFKESNSQALTTVFVNADYSINYSKPNIESDERFSNRVTWWENGPSICRYFNKYAYIPGVERPKLRNDDGSVDFEFFNWLECDNYVYNFPISRGMPWTGMSYYEVLTSDINLSWKKANKLNDDSILDRMVVVGTYAGSDRTFHGLCRFETCRLSKASGTCPSKVVNKHSREMFENMPVYPGLLHWSNKDKQWKCQNLLVTQDIDESLDYSKFEVLVK